MRKTYTQEGIRARMARLLEFGELTGEEWNPIAWSISDKATGDEYELEIFQPVRQMTEANCRFTGPAGFQWRLKIQCGGAVSARTSSMTFIRFNDAKADALAVLDTPELMALAKFMRENVTSPFWDT